MIKIKFDVNIMKSISIFESLTHASVKDCIEKDNKLLFIVKKGDIGKAIGKQGINIKKLEGMFKKGVRVIEHEDDILSFVRNVFYPNKAENITEEEGVVTITPVDSTTRGYMIGRGATNLRAAEDIVKRYFDIKEIRVI